MKIFKIDGLKIYEKYFKDMLLSDFWNMEEIPKGIDPEQMKNFTEHLEKIKDIKLGPTTTVNDALMEIDLRQL